MNKHKHVYLLLTVNNKTTNQIWSKQMLMSWNQDVKFPLYTAGLGSGHEKRQTMNGDIDDGPAPLFISEEEK